MPDIKVYGAGFGGLLATSFGIDNLGAVLDLVIKLMQIGVAAVTILYIYSKWKAMRASKKDDNDDPS
jgi:hypothetical protein